MKTESIQRAYNLLGKKHKRESYFLIILFGLVSAIDALGEASALPFLYVIAEPTIVDINPALNSIF